MQIQSSFPGKDDYKVNAGREACTARDVHIKLVDKFETKISLRLRRCRWGQY
jgi:hypothetical protein